MANTEVRGVYVIENTLSIQVDEGAGDRYGGHAIFTKESVLFLGRGRELFVSMRDGN
jgi:hypothetical protein